jgi:hypothetical protein
VKEAISAEVQRQIALENAEAQQVARNAEPDPTSSGIVRMLSDKTPHAFVAGADLDVLDARGAPCVLSQGDVMQFNPAPLPPEATEASLVVLASKPQECVKGSSVSVPLTDLQEMQNHMRATIDAGLGEMQGARGLPPIPQSAKAMPMAAPFAATAPPPDPTAGSQVAQQVQEADKAEKDVVGESPDGAASAPIVTSPLPAPRKAIIGQTVAEIESMFGRPSREFDSAGNKMIYLYKDPAVKIVFKEGKVIDIQ